MGGGIVAAGLLLSAMGFGGRCLVQKLPKISSHLNEILKSIPMNKINSKYYKGGFQQTMTRREALLILGISGADSRLKIKEAHKRIMLLNHPDRGGSPYLAAKINEAKEYIESCKP